MMLVLDNNIFFSLMNPGSINSYVFSSLRSEFFAPLFLKSELNKHKSECLLKSKLSEHEFEIRQAEVEEKIKFCRLSEYKDFLKEARRALPDQKDSPYIALALSLNAPVWSNDPHLKQQSLIEVYSTEELIRKLLSGSL